MSLSTSPSGSGSGRSLRQRKPGVLYDQTFHPMDEFILTNASTIRAHIGSRVTNDEPRRKDPGHDHESISNVDLDYRSTRSSPRHRAPGVLHEARFHPMDIKLRPNARSTLRYMQRVDDDAESSPSFPDTTKIAFESIESDEGNLLTSPISDHWKTLTQLDRKLYDLQQGAPDGGNAIPNNWKKVARILIAEHYFTRDEYKSWGGDQALKHRYEGLRRMLQGEHADKEPKDLEDRREIQMEGFDIFDYQPSDGQYVFADASSHQHSITVVANAESYKGDIEEPRSGIDQAISISNEDSVIDDRQYQFVLSSKAASEEPVEHDHPKSVLDDVDFGNKGTPGTDEGPRPGNANSPSSSGGALGGLSPEFFFAMGIGTGRRGESEPSTTRTEDVNLGLHVERDHSQADHHMEDVFFIENSDGHVARMRAALDSEPDFAVYLELIRPSKGSSEVFNLRSGSDGTDTQQTHIDDNRVLTHGSSSITPRLGFPTTIRQAEPEYVARPLNSKKRRLPPAHFEIYEDPPSRILQSNWAQEDDDALTAQDDNKENWDPTSLHGQVVVDTYEGWQ